MTEQVPPPKRQISEVSHTKCSKCRYYLKFVCAHLFSQIGLCALVVGYTIMGAFAFEAIENSAWSKNHQTGAGLHIDTIHPVIDDKISAESPDLDKLLKSSSSLESLRTKYVNDLWNITLSLNVLYEKKWMSEASERFKTYEKDALNSFYLILYANAKKKKEKEPEIITSKGQVHWTFPAALLYSITVITTIGYGNIAPRTAIGKVVTIFYALIGIPLMLLFLTNIGDLLAHAFKFTYNKICCSLCRKPPPIHCEEILLTNNQPITNQLMSPVLSSPTGRGSPLPDVQQYTGQTVESCIEEPVQKAVDQTDDGQVRNSSVERESAETDSHGEPDGTSKYPEIIMMPEILSNSDAKSNYTIEKQPLNFAIKQQEYNEDQNRVPVFIVLMFVAFYVCLGAAIFSIWEKWSFLDGAYFCFITLSTIGFGDLVPGMSIFDVKHEQGQAKLIICCFYLVIGLAIIAMSFNLVQEEVLVKCRRVGRNLGIYKDH